MREMLSTHKDVLLKSEQLERRVLHHDDIRLIFDYLEELLNPKTDPTRRIGFKHNKDDSLSRQSLFKKYSDVPRHQKTASTGSKSSKLPCSYVQTYILSLKGRRCLISCGRAVKTSELI